MGTLILICASALAQNLFVAEYGAIYKVSHNGMPSIFASGWNGPGDLAFDSAGNLFVADAGSGSILKFTPGALRTTFASGLNFPIGLAFDSSGNLFLADGDDLGGPHAIYKFTPNGVRSTVPSANDIVPSGLAVDSADNLFVSDRVSGNIFKITPGGVRSTFVSGFFGSGFSGFLALQPPHPATPALVNISARGSVDNGENVLIGGFIVTGGDPKQVIIRGLGSTLTSFGVPDALQDPVVELHNATSIMTTNDDWQSAGNANQIPMNYRPSDSRESAIMITLQSGAYTTILSGKNATTGNGLLEVYSPLSGLSNASIRGFAGTADAVLIGGFISSGGNGNIQLVIRALGPTLTQFGVNGALADPTLTLLDSNGNVVAFNDNWKNTQQSIIQATGFAPPDDLESAMLATLPNGNYTAIVSGKNGATGVGLLEVYKVAVGSNQ